MMELKLLYVVGFIIMVQGHTEASKLKMSMKLTDLTGATTTHACSKAAFTKCENKFQGHVEAVAAFKDETPSDKQDLWCQVLSSHKTCMEEVLGGCMADYPILSAKIQTYLEEVVHKGCTHEGPSTVDINKSCVHSAQRKRRAVEADSKNLYQLANECLKSHGKLDPTLQSLMDLLHNLNKARQHLIKRLPVV